GDGLLERERGEGAVDPLLLVIGECVVHILSFTLLKTAATKARRHKGARRRTGRKRCRKVKMLPKVKTLPQRHEGAKGHEERLEEVTSTKERLVGDETLPRRDSKKMRMRWASLVFFGTVSFVPLVFLPLFSLPLFFVPLCVLGVFVAAFSVFASSC
ncbi:MAG: hypothetical protein KDE45_00710, partial [Caldilineaceae bacterium]|nr:hypothetical protein [Caldilineaceae bacterium]